jgi:hypothetical protein
MGGVYERILLLKVLKDGVMDYYGPCYLKVACSPTEDSSFVGETIPWGLDGC